MKFVLTLLVLIFVFYSSKDHPKLSKLKEHKDFVAQEIKNFNKLLEEENTNEEPDKTISEPTND